MRNEDWLKPTFIILGVFVLVMFLMWGMPVVAPSIDWSNINIPIISLLPWFVAFGAVLVTLIFVLRRK